MGFNRSDVKLMREELQKAIEEFAESKGYIIKFGNASYTDTEVNFKVSVVQSGVDNDKAVWEQNCKYFGLVAEDYGKRIIINREDFTVAGLKPSARKNCIKVRRVRDGGEYVISRETFIRCGGIDAWA